MSAILGNSVTGSNGGSYTIDNSLRFRSSASAYLARTPSSNGSQTTWTWSGWIKPSINSSVEIGLFGAGSPGGAFCNIQFDIYKLRVRQYNGSVDIWSLVTSQVFRDPSSWYHIVVATDTTQATSTNRVKIYVNGSQITDFSSSGYPSQNQATLFNSTSYPMNLGRRAYGDSYYDGYMAEVRLIDGQALTPSSFGATNASTGVWQPKAYTGTYGTNGFYQKYSDIATTSASNAGLGKDFSGNSNYFVTNNISVTSGITYDAMTDSPTPKSATVGNFCTFSPLSLSNSSTADGNLKVTVNSGGTPDGGKAIAPFGMSDSSGKWYFEMTCLDPGAGNQRLCFGIANITTNPNSTTVTNGYYASASGAHGNYNIGTFTTNDVLQVAYDSNSNKLWFGKNGTWYNSGDPAAGTTPLVTVTSGVIYAPFSVYASSGQGPGVGAWNFGQRPFSYTPPTGFNRLQTYNLPTPTIGASSTTLANKYFDATTYTGNGSSQTVSNSGSMQPSFVWLKSRSNAYHHYLVDVLRGQNYYLRSSSTNGQNLNVALSFASTGFGLNSASDAEAINANGATYVGWQWNSPSSGSTNTSGSVTSTVSANTTAGFSIVTVTAPNGGTVGHGLGVAPSMMIAKRTDTTSNWMVQHKSAGVGYLILQSTQAYAGGDPSVWNGQFPSSSVIYTASGGYFASGNFVIYCFAEKAGFSKFGSYTGNGSTDGPFTYTGFRPRFVMIKKSNDAQGWYMYDSARGTYNVVGPFIEAQSTAAEGTFPLIDFLSNGFKIRESGNGNNTSGGTYIYMAFAENPFNYSLAR